VVPRDLSAEDRQAGLDDPRFDDLVAGAKAVGTGCFAIPGSRLLLEGLFDDLEAMRPPLSDVAGSCIDRDLRHVITDLRRRRATKCTDVDHYISHRSVGARIDTAMLRRGFLDWLRGEPGPAAWPLSQLLRRGRASVRGRRAGPSAEGPCNGVGYVELLFLSACWLRFSPSMFFC
jgi:hypothetical protein